MYWQFGELQKRKKRDSPFSSCRQSSGTSASTSQKLQGRTHLITLSGTFTIFGRVGCDMFDRGLRLPSSYHLICCLNFAVHTALVLTTHVFSSGSFALLLHHDLDPSFEVSTKLLKHFCHWSDFHQDDAQFVWCFRMSKCRTARCGLAWFEKEAMISGQYIERLAPPSKLRLRVFLKRSVSP